MMYSSFAKARQSGLFYSFKKMQSVLGNEGNPPGPISRAESEDAATPFKVKLIFEKDRPFLI
jgi:hypothetical protein